MARVHIQQQRICRQVNRPSAEVLGMLVHSCAGACTKPRGKLGLRALLARAQEKQAGETAEQTEASVCMAEELNGTKPKEAHGAPHLGEVAGWCQQQALTQPKSVSGHLSENQYFGAQLLMLEFYVREGKYCV